VRMIMRFSVNGHPMGSEILAGDGARLEISVASEVPIGKVEIASSCGDRCLAEPNQREVRITREEDLGPGWHYIRVTRSDGEMGWTSPIWIE
jgi:hypothetical protein